MRLTNDADQDFRPAWSPDGETIAFRRGDKIWTMDADGGNQVKISTGNAVDTTPDYSPDGSKIVFVSNETGDFEVTVMDANGSNRETLTQTPGFDGDPSWSPDGTKITFTRVENGRADIWSMSANGSGLDNLTGTALDSDATADWSPDGSLIAWALDLQIGSGDIYVMSPDGTNKRALTTDHASYNPDWQAAPPVQGDTDCDGDVDSADGLFVLRDAAGLSSSAGCLSRGDVDCDGDSDTVDALAILRYTAGLPPLPRHDPCAAAGDPV